MLPSLMTRRLKQCETIQEFSCPRDEKLLNIHLQVKVLTDVTLDYFAT